MLEKIVGIKLECDCFTDGIGNFAGDCKHFHSVLTNAFKRNWSKLCCWINPTWYLVVPAFIFAELMKRANPDWECIFVMPLKFMNECLKYMTLTYWTLGCFWHPGLVLFTQPHVDFVFDESKRDPCGTYKSQLVAIHFKKKSDSDYDKFTLKD